MGHGFGFVFWPVSLLMVCHTRRLEWVKSIDSTVSVYLSPFGVKPCHEFCGSSGPLGVGFGLIVGMQEFFAVFVPAGNIVLSDSPRDVSLGGVGQHHAVGHVGLVDVGGGRHWQGFGCGVDAVRQF